MIKGLSLLPFMLLTVFSYGQEIYFEKNISYAARELKLTQKLTKSGDSLILESGKEKIQQVDILNEDYLETITLNSNEGKIDLKKLAIGNYVIQAKIGKHWIVMYMEKSGEIDAKIENTAITNETPNEYSSLNVESLNQTRFDKSSMYWVVYESNSQFSSWKTMSFKYVDEIYDLISKVEVESRIKQGKYNKLFVYEIYDRSLFIQKQRRNKGYYKSKKSKFFNVLPLYSSENEK